MPDTPLIPVFGGVFQAVDFLVLKFLSGTPGRTATLDVTTERARHMRFIRIAG